ncbi:MAG: hypothetical protein C0524_16535 [Rhodobacter sp.]|nr:hypothetical protein [Rhodobacter sp.]
MTRLFLTLSLIPLTAAACTPTEQRAAVGALGGAAIGAAVSSDSDRKKGALIGAAVGAATVTLIGPAPTQGQCYYRDQYGQQYIAPC